METIRNVLAGAGCLFVGAGIGLLAEHFGCPSDIGGKLFASATALLIIWVIA